MNLRSFARFAASLLLLTVTVSVAGAAMRDNPQLHLIAADQMLARAVVLQKADLPKLPNPWKGGALKANVTGETCPNYKESDLVVTGAASTNFQSGNAIDVASDIWVLQTAGMAQLDSQRQPSTAVELKCVRSSYAGEDTSKFRLVSASRLAFPHVAPYTDAVRVVYDWTTDGQTTRLIHDYVSLAKDRVEINLFVGTAYSVRNGAKALEASIARLLVSRATPPKIIGYSLPSESFSATPGGSYTFGGLMLKLDKVNGMTNTGPISVGLPPETLSCTATIGGAPVVGTGKGGCHWQIPSSASGKQLIVLAHVTLMRADTTLRIPIDIG
jgi:hypothetical protein